MGLERRVTPLLHWLRAQTSAQTGTVGALSSSNLADATLQDQKELRYKIIPPPPLAKPHNPVQFLPMPPEAEAPPPETKQVISTEDMWGDTLNILLRLCNVTAHADSPPSWDVIAPLSKDRD